MAHQTSVNGGFRFRNRSDGILDKVSELGGDVATLAELQLQLTLVDAKEALGRGTWPTVVLLAAGAVLVTTVPVLLIGLAFVVASVSGMSQGAALLITGGIVAAIAGVLAFISLREFTRSFASFRRSSEELARNVNWIKTVLAQSAKTVHRS